MDTTTALTFEAPEIRELQQLLPDYEVRDFIAQGGMGAVYRAHFRRMDLEVAIKVLPREFSGDAGFRRQFEAEARAMGRLHHQNLLRVFDFGEVGGMAYIVMEYVNGKALHYSAYGVTVEQVEAARLMLGVCLGLAHAQWRRTTTDIYPQGFRLWERCSAAFGYSGGSAFD